MENEDLKEQALIEYNQLKRELSTLPENAEVSEELQLRIWSTIIKLSKYPDMVDLMRQNLRIKLLKI